MRSVTRMLKNKYMYYFRILDNSRWDLFSVIIWDNSINNYSQTLDTDKLTSFMFNINYMYYEMIKKYKYYRSYRNIMIKRFEQKKNKIKKECYRKLLYNCFITDIANEIVDFLF